MLQNAISKLPALGTEAPPVANKYARRKLRAPMHDSAEPSAKSWQLPVGSWQPLSSARRRHRRWLGDVHCACAAAGVPSVYTRIYTLICLAKITECNKPQLQYTHARTHAHFPLVAYINFRSLHLVITYSAAHRRLSGAHQLLTAAY